MKIYAGCMVSSRLPFIEAAAKFVLEKIGANPEFLEGMPCCMEPVGMRSVSYDGWKKTTSFISEKTGGEKIVTICDSCAYSFERGGLDVETFVQTLFANKEKIKSKIISPVNLKVAVFPGCHCESICASKGINAFDAISELLKFAGCETIIPEKNLCCGGGVSSIDDAVAKSILSESVESFKSSGAEAVAVSCPFCFMQFDVFARYRTYNIAEILAKAMGWQQDCEKYHKSH